MSYEAAIASTGGDEATLTKYLIISLEDTAANWYSRLLPRYIYILATTQRKVPAQFLGFPSGAQYGRRFSILYSKRKRNACQFLPVVPATEGLGSESIS
jgi:hypothetical protein